MRHHILGLAKVFLIAILVSLCSSAVAENHHPPVAIQTGFYYTVQKGDTLWNLSRKFMNSPFTWPGLWQKNEQIPNPHWIYPGQRIQLHLRNDIHDPAQTGGQHFSLPEEPNAFYNYSRIDQAGFIKKQPVEPSGRIFKAIEDVAVQEDDGTIHIGRKALRDAIAATSNFDGITGNLNCDDKGDCADPKVNVSQIQNGEYVVVWTP